MFRGKLPCLIFTCTILVLYDPRNFADCQSSSKATRAVTSSNPKAATAQGASPNVAQTRAAAVGHETFIQAMYALDPSERFCKNLPNRPFYQRIADGAVCCRGKQLPVISVIPEVTGECAISTRTDPNGMLDSGNLWCAYTCSLKKLGAIDIGGKVVPEVFFTHLSDGLTEASKNRVRTVMTTYLGCFKPMKNSASPCHTPLSFQKCFLDALYYLCSFGMPKQDDLTKIKKLALDYEKLTPSCYYNNRKAAPGCCHGKPMPWTPMEIIEAPSNDTKNTECLSNMGLECDATCFLNNMGVVNSDMELDVGVFQNKVLQHFPAVKASTWMDYLGPVFLFYDEVLADMGDESSDTAHRVCRFHDRIMELHESKVEQYCSMTPEEVKELMKNNAASSSG